MPDSEDRLVPDVYCDQFMLQQSAYGIILTFQKSSAVQSKLGPPDLEPQAVVRMSLEHAKVMTMMLHKTLKQYELEHLGDSIKISAEVLRQLNLSEEDLW